MRHTKALARSVHEVALKIVSRRESHTVDHRVQLAVASFQLFEKLRDFFVLRNIAHEGLRARQRQNQVLRLHLHPLVLIRDGEVSSRPVQSLRDCPSDRSLVSHSENNRRPPSKILKHTTLPPPKPIRIAEQGLVK